MSRPSPDTSKASFSSARTAQTVAKIKNCAALISGMASFQSDCRYAKVQRALVARWLCQHPIVSINSSHQRSIGRAEMSHGEDAEPERRHYSYVVTLRVRHPDIDPRDITAALGIEPEWTWRAGEARRTRLGTPLSGVYKLSYWYATLCEAEYRERGLVKALNELLDRLSPFGEYFESIQTAGGHIEFFIGWTFYHNSGEVFEPELLARLADLHIALSLDVYNVASET